MLIWTFYCFFCRCLVPWQQLHYTCRLDHFTIRTAPIKMWKQLVWERSTYWGTGWLGEFLPLLQCRRSGLKVLWQGQVTPKHFLDIFHVFVRHPKVVPAQKGMHVWHREALKDKGMHLWYWRSQEIKYHQHSLWHAQTIEVQFLNAGTWSVCTTTTTKKKNIKKTG